MLAPATNPYVTFAGTGYGYFVRGTRDADGYLQVVTLAGPFTCKADAERYIRDRDRDARKRERFAHLQSAWARADEKMHDYDYQLRHDYGSALYAPNGKRERSRRLDRAEGLACDRFLRFLKELNPARDWSRGFPVGYLLHTLTYADAVTLGRMENTPPPAFGYTQADAEAFSGPVAKEGETRA